MTSSSGPGEELDLDSPFWRFALRVYARPAVAPQCLSLQDENGIDVNLLLFAAWCGCVGRRLQAGDIEAVAAQTRAWTQGVVVQLRRARRAWKELGPAVPMAQAGRETLKSVELLSERIVCAMLHEAHARLGVPVMPGDLAPVQANIALVLARAGVEPVRAKAASDLLAEASLAAA
jgi:uncharacterized protein (TIGR02444 family)